jgi:hypothetical protein
LLDPDWSSRILSWKQLGSWAAPFERRLVTEVGILGLHKIEERPVAQDGQVLIRPMMYVALSYDHRIVDGREAVQFLVQIKQLLEDPAWMLVEGKRITQDTGIDVRIPVVTGMAMKNPTRNTGPFRLSQITTMIPQPS